MKRKEDDGEEKGHSVGRVVNYLTLIPKQK